MAAQNEEGKAGYGEVKKSFLQETHISLNQETKIRRRWQCKVLSAPFNTQARGVMTLIHKSIPLNITKGRWIPDDSRYAFDRISYPG